MKKIVFTLSALMSLTTLTKAQVTSPGWLWPANSSYYFFGAPELGQSNTGKYSLLQDKTNGTTFLNSPNIIYFRINNADRMTLANNGNVGIGNITPQFPLQVTKHQAAFTYIAADNAGPVGAGTGSGFAITEGNSIAWYMRGVRDNTGRFFIGNHTGNIVTINPQVSGAPLLTVSKNQAAYTYIAADNAGTVGAGTGSGFAITEGGNIAWYIRGERNGTGDFNIGIPGAGNRLTIDAYGNVGIGVQTLNAKNPNGYKLAVNGTIGAKAVKVEVSSSTWSDYVFEKDYKLKTLNELESYVKTNKHLPNVPSACEVEENGIDIANMDATLLAKIEELTLYIIEQNKRIEVLEKAAKN